MTTALHKELEDLRSMLIRCEQAISRIAEMPLNNTICTEKELELIDKVIRETAIQLGVPTAEIRSRNRTARASLARAVATHAMLTSGIRRRAIAETFGLDPTTTYHQQRMVNDTRSVDKRFNEIVTALETSIMNNQ
jgi:chromosomal replication initiation ATPase DnaA